jgi:hypothetical protein
MKRMLEVEMKEKMEKTSYPREFSTRNAFHFSPIASIQF